MSGTLQSLESITLDDLKAFYTKYFSPTVSGFHIAGDVAQAAEVAPSDGRKQTDDTETSDDAAETGNAKSAAYGDTANPTDAPGADGNGGNPQSAD